LVVVWRFYESHVTAASLLENDGNQAAARLAA
jgi:hypothetical protein